MSVNECCVNDENKIEISREVKENNEILIKKICKMCFRNHYELIVDPIKLGMEIK